MPKHILRFLKEPLLHFLLIGASFYLINGLYGESTATEDDRRIVISVGEVEWLQDSWKKRSPTPHRPSRFVRDRSKPRAFSEHSRSDR